MRFSETVLYLKEVNEADDIGMTEVGPVFDLARQKLFQIVSRRLLLVNDLNSGLLNHCTTCEVVSAFHLQMDRHTNGK